MYQSRISLVVLKHPTQYSLAESSAHTLMQGDGIKLGELGLPFLILKFSL